MQLHPLTKYKNKIFFFSRLDNIFKLQQFNTTTTSLMIMNIYNDDSVI